MRERERRVVEVGVLERPQARARPERQRETRLASAGGERPGAPRRTSGSPAGPVGTRSSSAAPAGAGSLSRTRSSTRFSADARVELERVHVERGPRLQVDRLPQAARLAVPLLALQLEGVRRVVHAQDQPLLLPGLRELRELELEGRVAALVRADRLPSSQPLVFQSEAPTTRKTRFPAQPSGTRIVRAYHATSASSATPDSFEPQGNGTWIRSGNASAARRRTSARARPRRPCRSGRPTRRSGSPTPRARGRAAGARAAGSARRHCCETSRGRRAPTSREEARDRGIASGRSSRSSRTLSRGEERRQASIRTGTRPGVSVPPASASRGVLGHEQRPDRQVVARVVVVRRRRRARPRRRARRRPFARKWS